MTSARDDRRTQMLAIVGIGLTIGLVKGMYNVFVAPAAMTPPERYGMVYSNIAFWGSWAVLGLGVIEFGRRVPLSGPRKWRAVLLHAGGSLVFAVAHMKVWSLAFMVWQGWTDVQPFTIWRWVTDLTWVTRLFALFQFEWEITIYWSLLGVAHALAYRDDIRERALLAARLDAELAHARLQVLQRQMYPHFFFNTLQSISVLMHHSVEAAEQMLERLGALLRASLRANNSGLTTLAQELEYVGHYLAIEQLNLGSRLVVHQDVPVALSRCQVPELLLQPLVENAVRHGIAPLVQGGHVWISAGRTGDRLILTVRDDGTGTAGAMSGAGVALANIRRRLQLLYSDHHTFDVTPGDEGRGTTVRVTIPATDAALA